MISVIIPCFNSERFIVRAIESVLKQTYKNYEIIVVDNNSFDNTTGIIYDYMNRCPNKIKVLHEYKKGAPAARNKGLYEAKGEWIQFLDSDDELLPDKLKQQIEVADSSEADVVTGSSYIYKVINNKLDKSLRKVESGDVWKGLLTSKLGITSANLWKRKALLAVEGWDENKSSSQEYDLLFRMLKNNSNISFCPVPLTIVHINPNSVSNSQNDSRIVEILDNSITLRLEIKDYLKSQNKLTKELNQATDKHIYLMLISYSSMISVYFKKGIIPMYVRKTLKKTPLDLPVMFIIKLYTRRIINKLKQI
ncbi:MAG TPA: glycosyltransferase [Segetibacter sp.]